MESHLDYFADPNYMLCMEHMGCQPHYVLPTWVYYPEDHDVYMEMDELIPTGNNSYSIIYFIHDMDEKTSKKWQVNGEFKMYPSEEGQKEMFIIASEGIKLLPEEPIEDG